MTLMDDIEDLGILPEGEYCRPGDAETEKRRTYVNREAARARMIAMNKSRSFVPPKVGTHAARILSILKHGTQGTAQIAKAVFSKTRNHAQHLRNVGTASSILTRLARRGFVKRAGYARWSLIPKVTACQDQESEGSKPQSG